MSLCVHGPYSHHTDFTLVSYCTAVSYFRLLISIILSDCVCMQGPYSHLTDFILITYIFELFQTFDKCIFRCDCVCRGHTAIPQIFTLISYISELLLISIILCDCVCRGHYNSHPTDFHFNQLHQ